VLLAVLWGWDYRVDESRHPSGRGSNLYPTIINPTKTQGPLMGLEMSSSTHQEASKEIFVLIQNQHDGASFLDKALR